MASRALGQDLLVGFELGHYRIAEKIGAGGMGEVYRASDEHLARDVAIKVLPPGTLTDESARKHFHKEALILSKLNHPNVATIHDFDTQQGVDFLVMEYIPGITLSEKVAGRPLPEKEVLRLGVQLAEGLAAAHEHGVIHRDLKPGNLRVTSDGRLKILDFGLAKLWHPVTDSAATESLSETQAMAGTVPYMAPEQLLGGAIDARTDLHAAGSVLYKMATGQRPFAEVEQAQLIAAILHRPPRPPTALNPQVSPELGRIIGKCLEKEPENRYQSAKELAVDLRQLGVHPLPVTPAPSKPRTTWKRTGILAGLVLAALALILGSNLDKWRERQPGHGTEPIRSLAVLPLKSLSSDQEQEYFTEGMTEALITELGSISALRVISHQSVMQYKGSRKSVPQIAHELNVEAVVEGSIMRARDQVRITVQLIDGRTDRHLWADSYQRHMGEILSLQNDVARAIAAEVKVKLTPQEENLFASAQVVNPAAHEAYLKGLYYVNRWSEPESVHCIESLKRATEIEPSFADAQAALAICYTVMPWTLPPKDVFPQAKVAAKEAIRLDANQAEAYAALGAVNMFYEWDWRSAEQNLRRAVELNQNRSYSRVYYADYFAFLGRTEEAIREAKEAVLLDPASTFTNRNLAFVYQLAHKYPEYAAQAQTMLELAPNNGLAKWDLAWAFALQGKKLQAAEQLKAVIDPLGRAIVLATMGENAQARHALKEAGNPTCCTFDYAMVYASLGEKDAAIRGLEKALDERDAEMVQLYTIPAFDSLRSDPRFQSLLRRMNFPP